MNHPEMNSTAMNCPEMNCLSALLTHTGPRPVLKSLLNLPSIGLLRPATLGVPTLGVADFSLVPERTAVVSGETMLWE